MPSWKRRILSSASRWKRFGASWRRRHGKHTSRLPRAERAAKRRFVQLMRLASAITRVMMMHRQPLNRALAATCPHPMHSPRPPERRFTWLSSTSRSAL